MRDGTKLNERFRSSETVERARLEQKPYQFLFEDDDLLTFMDTESYEQVSLSKEMVGDKAIYLKDGMELKIESYEDEPLNILLPEHLTFEITETEPTVKGQTAASSYKPAILENGVRIMVPPFCSTGEKVVVNTETSEYTKRAD